MKQKLIDELFKNERFRKIYNSIKEIKQKISEFIYG